MTVTYVLMQNLKRNPLRTLLTAAAFALPMAVFVAAISLVVTFIKIGQINERELRLAVRSRTSLTMGIPQGIRRKIEMMDPDHRRLRAVCGMRWFGGRVPETQNTLTSLAADADAFPIVHSDLEMTSEYTFVTPERQNELTRKIQEKLAEAGKPAEPESISCLMKTDFVLGDVERETAQIIREATASYADTLVGLQRRPVRLPSDL